MLRLLRRTDRDRRIRELEDERALRELVARYSFNADFFNREDGYIAMYTDDGAIDCREMGWERFEGKDGLKRFIESPQARGMVGKSMHHAAPTNFHIDGDEAIGEGYSVLYALNDDGSINVPHANVSKWTFRRADGEWKIVERTIKLLGSPTAGDLITRSVR